MKKFKPEHLFELSLNLFEQRYISPDTCIKEGEKILFNFSSPKDELQKTQGLIILLSRMRDKVREVDLNKFFRSIEHRDEVFKALIEALESLEEKLEELEEQQLEAEMGE